MATYPELLFSLVLIFVAAKLFTNGIEWLGRRLDLSHGATGSLMAALGTALPEAIIPIWAIAFGSGEVKEEIGVGAILGAPLLLATLGFLISGAAAWFYSARKRRGFFVEVDPGTLGRDLPFFVIVYSLAAVAGLVPGLRPLQLSIAALLVLLYAGFVLVTLRAQGGAALAEAATAPAGAGAGAAPAGTGAAPAATPAAAPSGGEEGLGRAASQHAEAGRGEVEVDRLYFQRRREVPATAMVLLQVAVGLGAMIFAANVFVDAVTQVAKALGVSAFILSVIITPIATELPETFNSVIWLGQRKDTLAIGNITGAMVLQSSLIPAIGIAFTPWRLAADQLWAVGLAVAAAAIVLLTYYLARRKVMPQVLVLNGLLYALYIAVVA